MNPDEFNPDDFQEEPVEGLEGTYDVPAEYEVQDVAEDEEVLSYTNFETALAHMKKGYEVSVDSFGQKSRILIKDNDLFLKLEGSPFPMAIALEGAVLMSETWVLR